MENLQQRVISIELRFSTRKRIPEPTLRFLTVAKRAITDMNILTAQEIEESIRKEKQAFLIIKHKQR